MLHRVVNSLAMAAALAALVVGMARGAPLLAVGQRAVVSYLVAYAVSAVLVALLRVGLSGSSPPQGGSAGRRRAERGTGGTNTAD